MNPQKPPAAGSAGMVPGSKVPASTGSASTAPAPTTLARSALAETVLARTVELARIPAPTGAEHDRAAVVRRWWEEDGWRPRTDANAAYAAGIPAVALGVTRGEGEHTPQEWIETAPVADGLGVLAETIRLFGEGQQ
jgi:acetylornithine deacetylase/succinyl-diaminopimelate desuccinylase-like protein